MAKRSSSKQPDSVLLTLTWGSLWGVALGTWLLIPYIVNANHIRPAGGFQWLGLLLALVVIFAIIGTFLGLIGGFLLAAVEHFTVGSFRDRVWACGLFAGVLIVFGYLFDDYVVHFTAFGTLRYLSFYSHEVETIVVFGSAISAYLTVVYLAITRRAHRLRPVTLAVVLGVAGAAGALAAPARCVENLSSPNVGALTRAANPIEAPLLFIGLDGATWRVLEPAIDKGLAPTFGRLLDRGTSGDVEALWPPYWSSPAWASILTGLPQDATGVYEDLAAIAPGLAPFQVPLLSDVKLNPIFTMRSFLKSAGIIEFVPPPRSLLRGKPVWQLLHDAGVNTAVIRFRFTYPPNGEADVMVSDWVGSDAWEAVGVRHRATPDTVFPASRSERLLAPFRSDRPDSKVFGQLVPGPLPDQPADAMQDPFEYLRASADVDERTFEVSMAVLKQNPKQPFLAVYLDGLDSAEHAFWQYRFPEDFESDPPAPQDVKRLGPVIDRYVHFVDEGLKALLALYQEEPNVVIISDHGHGRSTMLAGWRGWHTKTGILLAAGPSISHTKDRIPVSYYDILPTLAFLKGFDTPSSLKGVALFRNTPAPGLKSN